MLLFISTKLSFSVCAVSKQFCYESVTIIQVFELYDLNLRIAISLM